LSFLLDTNAVSESRKPRPDERFLEWLTRQEASDLHVSVLTVGELRRGVLALDPGRKRAELARWVDYALGGFQGRVLPVGEDIASLWARLWDENQRAGRKVGVVDELIAATALAHDLTLVTRNTRHFEHSGCRLLSPWAS